MKTYIQSILSTILLCIAIWTPAGAQEFRFLPDRYENPYYSRDIKTNPSGAPNAYGDVLGTTSADEWYYMTANPGTWTSKYQFKSVSNYIKVGIDQESKAVEANYKYQITLQVKGYSDPSNPSSFTTQNHSFVLEYDKDSLAKYKDATILKLPGNGFYTFSVTLLDVMDISGTTPVAVSRASLASNFYIRAEVLTQRYDNELAYKILHINSNYNSTSQELELSWGNYSVNESNSFWQSYMPVNDRFKPVKYELEWTYIDDYKLIDYNHTSGSVGYGNTAASFSVPYNFKNNATRIQTDNNNFKIPVVYGHGAIVFRIRRIRPDNVNYTTAVYGDWNLAESGVLTNSSFSTGSFNTNPSRYPSNCLFIIESPHQADQMNWQYSISFAEEGKYKHVLNYFDGMGKNRQTQTKINSDPDYVVGVDNIYDFEGRPAITTLPTPIWSNNLQYKPNLSLHAGTGQPYRAEDFDTGCVQDTIVPFASTALASVYYSPQNPNKAGMQQFVPDAEGYPFVQTLYSPDYTDKVLWQGEAGATFQRGRNHGTRYAYVRAGQKEINRLFGTESGYFQYYPKQVTIDPNGQASFAITDASGKTVATALAGAAPSDQEYPLSALDNIGQPAYTVQDILSGNLQQIDKYKRSAEYSYYNESPGYNGLRYGVDIAPFPTGCSNQFINVAGRYNFKIIDECGGTYLSQSGIAGESGITGSNQHKRFSGAKDSFNLVPGKYTILKELSFPDTTISRLANTFVDNNTGQGLCYTGKEVFVRSEVENTNFPCLAGDTLNECDALRQRLKSELYPGAKYGQYESDDQGNFQAGVANSIFTYYTPLDSANVVWTAVNGSPQTGDMCSYTIKTESWERDPEPFDPYSSSWNNGGTWTLHTFYDTEQHPYPYSITNPPSSDPHATKRFIVGSPSNCMRRDTLYPNNVHVGECLYEVHYFCDESGGGNASPTYIGVTKQVWAASRAQIPQTTIISQDAIVNGHMSRVECTARLDTGSIEIIECRDGKPYYRYQSDCLGAMNLSVSQTDANGVTTLVEVPLQLAKPEQLIAVFDDAIAETLLPLHPEYCKLLACDKSNFETRLMQVETYDQAVALGMHTLSGITARDPLCEANTPGAPFSVNQMSFFEADAQLSAANSNLLKRFDTMALAMAYCGCNASEALTYCREMQYAAQIKNMIMTDKSIKDLYIKSLKSLYLANRGLLKQRLTDGTDNSCGPCQAKRMTLIGQPNFTPVFDQNGDLITEGLAPDVLAMLNDRIHNTTDTSMPAVVRNQINMHTAEFCSAQVKTIMDDLQACGTLSHSDMATVQNYLNNYCTQGSMGESISPDIVRTLLLSMGKMDEMCQPFMSKYGIFSKQNVVEKGSYISKSPAFYTDLNNFISSYGVTTALMGAQTSGSPVYPVTLSQSNAFEKEILQQFGLSDGSSIDIQGFVHTYPISVGNTLTTTTYKLLLAGGGQTDTLFFSPRTLAGGTDLTPLTEPGSFGSSQTTYITFNKLHSALQDSLVFALAEGGLANKLAFVNLNKILTNYTYGTTRNMNCLYNIWSYRIPLLAPRSPEGVEECVNCELLRRTVNAYYTDAAYYGMPVNAQHPLFGRSMQNYLNYKLKKRHGIEDYEALMSGCALSDKIKMVAAPATVQATFASASATDFSAAQTFIQTMQQQAAFVDNRIDYFMFKDLSNNAITVWFDLNSIPEINKVKSIKDYILSNTPGGTAVYLPAGHTAEVFRTGSTSYSLPNSTATTASVRILNADGSYTDATRHMINSTSTDPAQISLLMMIVQRQAQNNPEGGFIKLILGNKLYRSIDYARPDKQAYLAYVYGLGSLSDNQVAEQLAPQVLKSSISAFNPSNIQLSYNSPWCSDSKRDLYYWDKNQSAHTGFQRLQTVLGQVKTSLGGNKLFPVSGSVNVSGSAGTNNNSVKAFRQGNGGAWYRIFGTDNKLYNIYLAPSDKMLAPAQEYAMVSVSPSLYTAEGATDIYRFNVVMAKGLDTVTVFGYTDFPIATGAKLQDVVLQDNYGQQLQCLDTNSCERSSLLTAVEQGEQLHYAYVEAAKAQLRESMAWHFPQQAVDTLYHSMQSQQYHYTLYYYDLAGNLTRTVPPQGVQALSSSAAAGVDAARSSASGTDNLSLKAVHQKSSEYRYNSFNQLVWQQTPDGGITEFFYDGAGRLVFSQNAVQRAVKKYSYTLYDDQSRPVETGQIIGDPNLAVGQHPDRVRNNIDYSMNGTGGTADWVRTKIREEVVATKYDEPLLNLEAQDNMLSPQENLRKRVSAILYSPSVTTQNAIESYYHYATHFSYDAMGNVKTLTHDNPYMDYIKQRFKRVDYDYDLLSGKVNMLSYNRGFADQFYQKYDYDADNRITAAYTSKDGIDWDRDAAYTYYKHGPLAEVQVGDLNVQGLQYAYTIQGWLKAINGDVLNPAEEMGHNGYADSTYPADVMAHALDYYAGDYKAIAPGVAVSHLADPSRSLYNGNIVRQASATAGSTNLIREYSYDQLHRIMQTQYSLYDNISHAVSSMADTFKNLYSYDGDGNLQTLQRYNQQAQLIDNFTYHYSNPAQNNKLSYVADAAPDQSGGNDLKQWQTADNYTYDAIGNLVSDRQEGIKEIRWTNYGKMLSMSKGTVQEDTMQLEFSYDGMGNRTRKDYWQNLGGNADALRTSDIYIRDAQGNILAVYKEKAQINGSSTIDWLNDQLLSATPTQDVAMFLQERVGSSGPFVSNLLNRVVERMGDWTADRVQRGEVFYVTRSPLIYGQSLQAFLPTIYADMIDNDFTMVGDALQGSEVNNNNAGRLISALAGNDVDSKARSRMLSHLIKETPDLSFELLKSFAYDASDASAEQQQSYFMELIATNGANALGSAYAAQAASFDVAPFWSVVLNDNQIVNASNFDKSADLSTYMLSALSGTDQVAVYDRLTDFTGNWLKTKEPDYIANNFSTIDRLNVVYESDKTVFLDELMQEDAMRNIGIAIKLIPGMTTIGYKSMLTAGVQSGILPFTVMQFINTPSPDNIDADTLYLAEHHLYGSNRLGIKYYAPGQYQNIYVPGATVVQKASARVPWYSLAYDEMVKKAIRNPQAISDRLVDTLRSIRELGSKEYELTDHLGNVLANVLDRKTGYGAVNNRYKGFHADVSSTTDYYPFGFQMNERSLGGSSRFGFNTQEKTDEIAGKGNHNTALFWEYDTRTARRWNLDPVDQISISNYAVNRLNPMQFNDPLGDQIPIIRPTPPMISPSGSSNYESFHDAYYKGNPIITDKDMLTLIPRLTRTVFDAISFPSRPVPHPLNQTRNDNLIMPHYPEVPKVKVLTTDAIDQGVTKLLKSTENGNSKAKSKPKELPKLDGSGKVHGNLPKDVDLDKYDKEDLEILHDELRKSIQQRIKVTSRLGRDKGHGERQADEQNLYHHLHKKLYGK